MEDSMIETQRCKILRLTNDDYEDVIKLYINHLVRKYLGGAIHDEVILQRKFEETIGQSKDYYYWVIRSITDNEFMGLVSLDNYHDGVNTEVSYQFLPHWWGKGIAEEVIRTIINFSFDDLALNKIVAETQTANIKSCRLLERLGMKLERKLHRFNAEQSLYSIENLS
jgi:ribosomal-protein-alanine N-acetyltransferase